MQFISLGLYFIAFVVSLEVRKIKFTVLRSYDFVPNNEHNELKDTTIISSTVPLGVRYEEIPETLGTGVVQNV